jgi:hypothetical protein
MKTKLLSVIALASLLPLHGFAFEQCNATKLRDENGSYIGCIINIDGRYSRHSANRITEVGCETTCKPRNTIQERNKKTIIRSERFENQEVLREE